MPAHTSIAKNIVNLTQQQYITPIPYPLSINTFLGLQSLNAINGQCVLSVSYTYRHSGKIPNAAPPLRDTATLLQITVQGRAGSTKLYLQWSQWSVTNHIKIKIEI